MASSCGPKLAMPIIPATEYEEALEKVIGEITEENMGTICDLCQDEVPPAEMSCPKQFVHYLKRENIISQENVRYLAELLYVLQRSDLLEILCIEEFERYLEPEFLFSTDRAHMIMLNFCERDENLLGQAYPQHAQFLKHKLLKHRPSERVPEPLTCYKTALSKAFVNEGSCSGSSGQGELFEPVKRLKIVSPASPLSGFSTSQLQIPKADPDSYNVEDGKCIIVNQKFNRRSDRKGPKGREGSDEDAAMLTKAFEALGYKVKQYDDLSQEGMHKLLRKISKCFAGDCLVLIILSHGSSGRVWTTDGSMKVEQICRYFYNDRCDALKGKPKIIMVCACQGARVLCCDCPDKQTTPTCFDNYIPPHPDFYMIYSTVDHFKSYRFSTESTQKGKSFVDYFIRDVENQKGTPFVHDFVRNLTNHNGQLIGDIMTEVKRNVSSRDMWYEMKLNDVCSGETWRQVVKVVQLPWSRGTLKKGFRFS